MNDSIILAAAGAVTGQATSKLVETAQSILGSLQKSLGFVGNLLGGLWSVAKGFASRLWQGVTGLFEVASGIFSRAWGLALKAGRVIWDAVGTVFQGIETIFVGLWRHTSALRAALWSTVTGWAKSFSSGLRTVLSEVWSSVLTLLTGAAKGVGSLLQSLWGLVGSIPYVGPAFQIAGAVAGVGALVKGVTMLGSALGTAGRSIIAAAVNTSVWARGIVTGALSYGKAAIGAVATRGGALIGSASSFVGGAINRGGSLLGSVAGSGAGAAGGAGSTALGVGGTLFKFASGFVSTIATVGSALLTLVGVGTMAGFLTKAISDAAKGAIEFSQNARALSATSGLSLGRSAGLMRDLAALGIKNAPGGNAGLFSMRAGAYGLPGVDSPDFAASFAQTFQRMQGWGVVGQQMAAGMAKSLGLDSPEWLRTATMNPRAIREQQGFARGVHQSLGLSPEALRSYSEEIPNFLNRLGTLWEGVKMKLATAALPILQSVLGGVTNYLAQNAQQISGWIQYAVRWLFVSAPGLIVGALSTIVGVVQGVTNSILETGTMLVNTLPEKLGGLVQWAADLLRSMAGAFGKYAPILIAGVAQGLAGFGQMVGGWMVKFGTWLDGLSNDASNPFRQFILKLALSLDGMIDTLKRGAAEVVGLYNYMTDWRAGRLIKTRAEYVAEAGAAMGVNDAPQIYNGLRNWLGTQPFSGASSSLINSGQQFISTTQGWADDFSKKAMAGGQGIFNGIHGNADWFDPSRGQGGNRGEQLGLSIANGLRPAVNLIGERIKPGVDSLASTLNNLQTSLGTTEERNKQLDELIRLQREGNQLAREIVTNARALPRDTARLLGFVYQAQAEAEGRTILGQ